MNLLINGENLKVDKVQSLKALLEELHVNIEAVVIEHNLQVVPRKDLAGCQLKDGDRIEIVHFVGGGAPAGKKAKKLVIVESPAKAKTINKFLGSDFQVEASLGHVRDLPKSKMGVDISHDFEPQYVIISKARKTVNHLKKQAKGKEGIYLAPDPDREGEAISWHLAHIFDESGKVPLHRVVFNEITKDAVQEAFRHPRMIEMNLVNAQQARRILDRIVGYELSPLLWRKVGRGLSAGRVQSVALRLIVDREREIRKFVPEEYWSLEAELLSEKPQNQGKIFVAKLDKIGEEKAALKTQEETEKIKNEIQNATFKIIKLEKKERSRRPQAPFTTSKLQQEAYNRLGFQAAKTMRVAQKLYEGVELGDEGAVGLITYMRTDSVNISATAQKEAAQYVRNHFGNQYLPDSPPVYKSKKGAQEAHEAIRPSSVLREPSTIKHYLSDEEYKLYDLIWRKFVASQMNPALDEHILVSIQAGERYFFKTTGRRNLFAGFLAVYGETPVSKDQKDVQPENEEEGGPDYDLPELSEGEILKLHQLLGNQHFTKPPARYNDASLVKTLEEEGIGRPSTYAPTIYTLVMRGYVGRKGGALLPTELGETVVDLLVKHFPKILDLQFTANMENELDRIEDGEIDWVVALKNFYQPFEVDIAAAREEMKNIRREAVATEYQCDVCGKPMMMKWGRFGKFLACSGFPECKYTRSIPTGFHCPQCGGDLVKRMSKKRRTFYGCSKYPTCTYIANQLPKEQGESKEGKPENGEPAEI